MAGRGIGMNVVAQAIEYLGGNMTIRSAASEGTEFAIKLPVSLSVIYAITFLICDHILSIPTSNVISIDRKVQLDPDEYSYYDLQGFLGIQGPESGPFNVLRVRHSAEMYSTSPTDGEIDIVVGEIIGNRPTMVMPVGELLAKAKLFAGIGIMENGDISLLIDVDSLPRE